MREGGGSDGFGENRSPVIQPNRLDGGSAAINSHRAHESQCGAVGGKGGGVVRHLSGGLVAKPVGFTDGPKRVPLHLRIETLDIQHPAQVIEFVL